MARYDVHSESSALLQVAAFHLAFSSAALAPADSGLDLLKPECCPAPALRILLRALWPSRPRLLPLLLCCALGRLGCRCGPDPPPSPPLLLPPPEPQPHLRSRLQAGVGSGRVRCCSLAEVCVNGYNYGCPPLGVFNW